MRCKKYKEQIILHLYGELSEKERADLEAHLKGCPECSKDLAYTKEVFHILDENGKEDIPEANWEKCWNVIDPKIQEIPQKQKRFFSFPQWVYATAAILFVFVLGMFIGRGWFFPDQKPTMQAALSKESINLTLKDYYEDLKPVLIEYSNYTSSVFMDKDVVRHLLIQNMLLKRIIAKSDPTMLPFLEDLDLVLREIANLKKEDSRTPTLIKDLIHERDILFKMEILDKI